MRKKSNADETDPGCPQTDSWTCDVCRTPIVSESDGIVTWLSMGSFADGPARGRGLRLVHRDAASPKPHGRSCHYTDKDEVDGWTVSDRPISEFRGPDGLMNLLLMILENGLPVEEMVELIKRLHIPGYEFVHSHLQGAREFGVYTPNTHPQFPDQQQIRSIIRDYLGRFKPAA